MTEHFSCIIVDDEPMAIELLTEQLGHLYKNMQIVACCANWEDALTQIRAQKFDLLFMDISIPGKTGIDILKLVPPVAAEIIFITAHEQYAVEAFRFSATGYLLKPVSDAELAQVVNVAIDRIINKRAAQGASNIAVAKSDKIGIPNKNGIDYLNTNDILYLESVNKCTKIVTTSKEYMSLSPLLKFHTLTETHNFLQVHRSFIVNLNCILRYESSGLIIMSNKSDIPLARSFKSDFLLRFNNNF
jgi:two-component system, LytTR family, response regulator